LDVRQPYPRLEVVRRIAKDGARYFGPYTSASAVRETLRLINRHFQLRTCSDQTLVSRTRPCLQFQIKRCPAPCVFDLSGGVYKEGVDNVITFLEGRADELLGTLEARMRGHAAEMRYEAAAQTRDQLAAVRRSLEHQRIVSADFKNRDVVGLYREGPAVEIHVMRTRDGRLIDAQRYSFEDLETPAGEILSDFALRYYAAGGPSDDNVPDEILFGNDMEWSEALEELLSEAKKRRVSVLKPSRGEKRRLVELAQKNAHQAFVDKQRERGAAKTAIERLKQVLHLTREPHTLECFDISHLQGDHIVASLVRFDDGVSNKDLYRHYKIRSTVGQDDFQSMYEVISRRARRGLEEGDLPDLFVIDGGKGQLNAARAALDDHGISEVDLISLAKSKPDGEPVDDALSAVAEPVGPDYTSRQSQSSPERIFVLGNKNAIVLKQNSAELFLLMRARDEAHRFALAHQRRSQKKAMGRSALDDVPGIGKKRRQELLRTFGSVQRLKAASEEDIAKVIGKAAAARLIAHLASQ
jgi:excinuclease ABC subunit C